MNAARTVTPCSAAAPRTGVVLALAMLVGAPAQAQDRLDYTLGVSALHSDNIGLVSVDPQSDTVIAPTLGLDYARTGSVFDATLSGNLQYLDFRDDTFDDEFRGAFAGRARWTLLPERLEFIAEDYLSRQPVDSFAAFSPGNQQQTNVFVAGPTFLARLGATRLQTDLRYSRSVAEDVGTFDSDRYSLSQRLRRDLGPTRSLSLTLQGTQVDFDQGRDFDYRRSDVFATYESRLRTVDLLLDAGYSQLRFDSDRDDASGPLLRGTARWRPTSRSSFDAGLAYQFSDASQDLTTLRGEVSTPLQTGIGGGQLPIRPEAYRERRVDAGYTFDGARVTLSVSPYYRRLRYVDPLIQDQDETGGDASIGYRLAERTTLQLTVAASRRRYAQVDRRDEDSFAGLAVAREFTRHWSARIDLQRRSRSSSLPGQDYDEHAATVSVSYRR